MAVRKKRSISMPPDLDAEIAAAAADAGLSYSAWLADTARREFTIRAGLAVEPLDDGQARSAGALASRAAASDIVDACVVEGALRRRDLVVSSDPDDLQSIAAATGRRLPVDHP